MAQQHHSSQTWQLFFPVDSQSNSSIVSENTNDSKKLRGGRRKSTTHQDVETTVIQAPISVPVIPQPILDTIIKELNRQTSNAITSEDSSLHTQVKIEQTNSNFYLCSCQIPILPSAAEDYFLELQRQKHSSTSNAELIKNYIQDHNVEEIITERHVSNQSVQYLIKWKEYPFWESTWVSKKYAERYLPYQMRKHKKKIEKMNGKYSSGEEISLDRLAHKFAVTLHKLNATHIIDSELTIENFHIVKSLILEHVHDLYLLKQQHSSISLDSLFSIKDPQMQTKVKEELEYQMQQLFSTKYMFAANSAAYEKEQENLKLWINDLM